MEPTDHLTLDYSALMVSAQALGRRGQLAGHVAALCDPPNARLDEASAPIGHGTFRGVGVEAWQA